MRLGEYLRETREAKKIGLRAMAKLIEKSPSYLSKIEKGEFEPGLPVLIGYARELKIDMDTLLLKAGRLPPDVLPILVERPELLNFIRGHATSAETESGALSSIGISAGKSSVSKCC